MSEIKQEKVKPNFHREDVSPEGTIRVRGVMVPAAALTPDEFVALTGVPRPSVSELGILNEPERTIYVQDVLKRLEHWRIGDPQMLERLRSKIEEDYDHERTFTEDMLEVLEGYLGEPKVRVKTRKTVLHEVLERLDRKNEALTAEDIDELIADFRQRNPDCRRGDYGVR